MKKNLNRQFEMPKRMYSHKELAVMYYPNIQPRSASAQFGRWMRKNEDLMSELVKAGFYVGQRVYSPRQIEVLIVHIGIPDGFFM